MKLNFLNKLYAFVAIAFITAIGYNLWQEKGTLLFYYLLTKEKQEQMLVETEKFEWLVQTSADETCQLKFIMEVLSILAKTHNGSPPENT